MISDEHCDINLIGTISLNSFVYNRDFFFFFFFLLLLLVSLSFLFRHAWLVTEIRNSSGIGHFLLLKQV